MKAKAELEHNAISSLTKIKIQVLILSNDNDPYFQSNFVKEMGDLIPNSTVILYHKEGHVITDENYSMEYSIS